MSPETMEFNLVLFSIVTGLAGLMAFLKHLTQSKASTLPPRRHRYARS